MKIAALIVAAGRGTRAGDGLPKQWRMLAGESVAARSLRAFRDHPGIATCLLVVHPDDSDHATALGVPYVSGGTSRADSVRAGLEALADSDVTHVLIHDVARPLVSRAVIDGVIAGLSDHDGAAPGLPLADALWQGDATVQAIRPRDDLHRAQTPQGFTLGLILAAHRAHGGDAADDVEVALAAGLSVAITAGDAANFKLTVAGDLARAEQILRSHAMPLPPRVGNGYDVHRFGPGASVWLCGVKIAHDHGLVGHSDADVGMHALSDAIYGALAEGDIGRHFPPSDPQWKGAASRIFLAHAIGLARERGYTLGNADVTLICEEPKIGPHAEAMCAALAEILEVDAACISVKATTSERLGFTGRREGIAALATAMLVPA